MPLKTDAAASTLTDQIIGAAIEVHKHLGPGLLESLYESALCIEFAKRGIQHEQQVRVPVCYKGSQIGVHILDLVVEGSVILELKAVDSLSKVHEAQLLSYLRITGISVGLLINFNAPLLKNGLKRMIL